MAQNSSTPDNEGRPDWARRYTDGRFMNMPAVKEEICRLVRNKGNLYSICMDKLMPARDVVMDWLHADPAFLAEYNESRAFRAYSRGDKIDSITEMVLAGALDANSARVVIDAEKWQMTKEQPKMFGDRVAVEHDVSNALADAVQAARLRASAVVNLIEDTEAELLENGC